MPNSGYEISVSSRLHPQDAKSGLLAMKRYTFHEATEDLSFLIGRCHSTALSEALFIRACSANAFSNASRGKLIKEKRCLFQGRSSSWASITSSIVFSLA